MICLLKSKTFHLIAKGHILKKKKEKKIFYLESYPQSQKKQLSHQMHIYQQRNNKHEKTRKLNTFKEHSNSLVIDPKDKEFLKH